MQHAPHYLAYVDYRRKGVPAKQALAKAKTDPPRDYGNPSFDLGGNVTRQPDRPEYAWIENTSAAGLRFVDYADKLARLGHKGWYLNDDGIPDETYRGAVYRLPHSRGLIAGYADPWNDGAAFVKLRLWDADDEIGAAHAADRIAELEAERERDYRRAWSAGQRYRNLADNISTARRACLALIREVKDACDAIRDAGAIRATIREAIADYRHEISAARAEREKLEWDYGHVNAFQEGAQ